MEQFHPSDSEVISKKEFNGILNSEGKAIYRPELFSDEFNRLYSIYERAVSYEMRLRDINGGRTREYEQADVARRDAHIAAADQLANDLKEKGAVVTTWEAERIINKMVEEKISGSDEKEMLKRAFLLDVYERDRD